jgi:DNA modification methylase
MEYQEFLKSKIYKTKSTGESISQSDVNPILFGFQKDVVVWAVKKGRCAIFLDTGLGKTFIQLEWARIMGGTCLIIAPLSVARQTIREAGKININVNFVHEEIQLRQGINITNYELIDNFIGNNIDSIILDESSILKSISGIIKRKLIEKCHGIKYKLCCTATPAPNDYIEIGNHAQFLEICTHQEMLAMFFINANKEHTIEYNGQKIIKKGRNDGGQEWRIKHHAEEKFFEWMSSWAMFMMKPSDLGYEDDGFILPKMTVNPIIKEIDNYHPSDSLFFMGLSGISDRAEVRSEMADVKSSLLNELIQRHEGQWIIWCGLDKESTLAKNTLGDICREVSGKDNIESKISNFEDFQDGKYKVLITKPKIGGYGMNFQNACNMIFFGLNDSWETYYQAIRREWRFGQKQEVNVYILITSPEIEIYDNIKRKELQASRLREKMIERMKQFEIGEIMNIERHDESYDEMETTGDGWKAIKGDSCVKMKEIKDESIDLSVYSPPFADLFVYSNSERDLGNCRNWEEFFEHYSFIVGELFRITKPGRLSCVHTSDIPAMANRDGFIGLKDFPGEVIRLHQKQGWTFFGRIFIQKNPQAQAIRVKSKSLLFVQMKKDSSHSRPALIDQVLIFKKPGDTEVPVEPVKNGELDNETWISWAHGIWTDISETNTLRYYHARESSDEKHICPLQLETIERCVKLYSNPGETVFTPFMGIGSEAYTSVKYGRNAIGIELKDSYYKTAVNNLQSIETSNLTLFG